MDRDGGVRVILGRTPEGLIKIKKDEPLGLRAVNCACCGGGCLDYLLYPGDLMNVKFNHNDLPDNMQFVENQFSGELDYFSLTKISPFFATPYRDIELSATFYYKTPSETDPDTGAELFSGVVIASGRNYWQWARYIGPSAEYPEERSGVITGDTGSNYAFTHNYLCSELGPVRDTTRFYWMFDLFADTLTVAFSAGTQTVTRGTRTQYPPSQNAENTPMVLPYASCEEYGYYAVLGKYSGGAYTLYFDYILDYETDNLISDSCKWKIKTPTGTFEKIGNGNTPVGSYGGGYTVS